MQGFLSDLFGGGGSQADEGQPPATADDAVALDDEAGAHTDAAESVEGSPPHDGGDEFDAAPSGGQAEDGGSHDAF